VSNEVNIRVTGANTSGNAINTAKRDVDDLGDAASKTSRRVVVLGESEQKAGREASALARKLLEASAAAKLAAAEMNRIGDDASIQKFRKAQSEYSKLAMAAKHVNAPGGGDGSLFDSMFKAAPKEVEKVGVEAAKTFSSAFEGGVMGTFKALPPEAKAALGASVAGAAIAAAPFIVSAVNGAILGGIGAGGLAAGIALQAKDPVVAGAFKGLGSRIMADLGEASKPFRAELLNTVDTFGASWTKIKPNVSSFFATIAPETSKLSSAVSKSIEMLGPSLAKAAGPAAKVLDAVAAEVPEIAQALANLLDDISDHGDSAAAAIKFILFNVEALIVGFDILVKTVGPAADGIVRVAQAIGLIDDTRLDHVITKLDRTNQTAQDAGEGMSRMGGSAEELSGTTQDTAASVEYMNRAVYNTADAADQANQAFADLFGQLMGLDEANLKVAEDFRKLGADIKKNKGSLDANTEAGEKNRKTILGIVDDLNAQREAAIANGNGTVEATQKANAAFLAQLQRVRDVAAANGANTAQLDAMIAKYRALAGLGNIVKSVTIINTAVYRTIYDSSGKATGESGRGLSRDRAVGGVTGAASGGNRDGLTMVGEEGWELVKLPAGSTVYTHGQSQRMMADGGGGGGMPGALVLAVQSGSDQAVAQMIQGLIRTGRIKIKTSQLVGR
jgi:hypothetical protein